MLTIPSAAYSIFMSFSIAFTKPTFQRILPFAVGALLTRGRQTITNILWTMRGMVPGHSSTYHRVFSRAGWSLWPLGKTFLWMTQLPSTAESVFMEKDVIMMPFVRPISTWSFDGGTDGSYWLYRLSFRLLRGIGLCPSWSPCIAPKLWMPKKDTGTRQRPIWPVN